MAIIRAAALTLGVVALAVATTTAQQPRRVWHMTRHPARHPSTVKLPSSPITRLTFATGPVQVVSVTVIDPERGSELHIRSVQLMSTREEVGVAARLYWRLYRDDDTRHPVAEARDIPTRAKELYKDVGALETVDWVIKAPDEAEGTGRGGEAARYRLEVGVSQISFADGTEWHRSEGEGVEERGPGAT